MLSKDGEKSNFRIKSRFKCPFLLKLIDRGVTATKVKGIHLWITFVVDHAFDLIDLKRKLNQTRRRKKEIISTCRDQASVMFDSRSTAQRRGGNFLQASNQPTRFPSNFLQTLNVLNFPWKNEMLIKSKRK